MIAMRRLYGRSIRGLITIALVAGIVGQVLAQSSTLDVPENASAERYGNGLGL